MNNLSFSKNNINNPNTPHTPNTPMNKRGIKNKS